MFGMRGSHCDNLIACPNTGTKVDTEAIFDHLSQEEADMIFHAYDNQAILQK